MKLTKIIYVKRNKDCICVWSADYPDIKRELWTFTNDINALICRMGIHNLAKRIEEEVRERNGEKPFNVFEIHIKGRT